MVVRADIFHFPGLDFADLVNSSGLPLWLVSILACTNYRNSNRIHVIFRIAVCYQNAWPHSLIKYTKFSLLGIWLIAFITLIIFGMKQAADFRVDASVTQQSELPITKMDTLYLEMKGNPIYSKHLHRDTDLKYHL